MRAFQKKPEGDDKILALLSELDAVCESLPGDRDALAIQSTCHAYAGNHVKDWRMRSVRSGLEILLPFFAPATPDDDRPVALRESDLWQVLQGQRTNIDNQLKTLPRPWFRESPPLGGAGVPHFFAPPVSEEELWRGLYCPEQDGPFADFLASARRPLSVRQTGQLTLGKVGTDPDETCKACLVEPVVKERERTELLALLAGATTDCPFSSWKSAQCLFPFLYKENPANKSTVRLKFIEYEIWPHTVAATALVLTTANDVFRGIMPYFVGDWAHIGFYTDYPALLAGFADSVVKRAESVND